VSIAGISLFVVCGAVAIASALFTITQKNPIRAAFALLAHIFALAGLFVGLQGHFLAVIQLIVYAGAVVVLFIFTIMYIGPEPQSDSAPRLSFVKLFSIAGMVVLTGSIAYYLSDYKPAVASTPACPEGLAECGQFGGVEAFSATLFRDGVVPFELISILLTVAVVGAIMVARGRIDTRRRPHDRESGLSTEANASSGNE
jgi:NADH-quinone oxidoreductase subunit J